DSRWPSLAPLGLTAAAAAWFAFRRGGRRAVLVLVLLGALLGCVARWPQAARALPLLTQLAICMGLMWLFGRTLLPGREPLVTFIARLVHGPLPAPIMRYTRNVTRAWTAFM